MRISSPLLGLILLASPHGLGSARADSVDSIALPKVLEVAVRDSPSLASARIDLDIAQAQVLQSLGIDDFLLQISGSYFRQSDKSVAGDVVGTDASASLAGEATLSKLLPTGGTVSLHARSSRRSSNYSFNNTNVTVYNSRLEAGLQQPLLRDREVVHKGQDQARHALTAAQLDLQLRAREEIRLILNAYWELVWAHKDLEIRRSALELAVERRRLTESAVKLGSAPRTALLEVDQVMATNEEDILLAEQRITVRSLELRRLAGLEIGPQALDLRPSEDLSVSPSSYALPEVVAKALQTSPELAALAERGSSALIEVEVAENGTLARLDLGLRAGPLGTAETLHESLGGMAILNGYFVGANLSYEQNLGRRSARGLTRAARAQLQRIKINERDLRAQIATAAAQAVQEAHVAKKRMDLSTRAIELSELNIEAERRRFEAGKSTNFDVLQRQEEQKQARLRYARAAVDYLRATISIQALSGDLLSSYGIELEQS